MGATCCVMGRVGDCGYDGVEFGRRGRREDDQEGDAAGLALGCRGRCGRRGRHGCRHDPRCRQCGRDCWLVILVTLFGPVARLPALETVESAMRIKIRGVTL